MSAKRVLVDTSAWIEYFREARRDVAQQVALVLSEQRAVTTGVVLGELLQGASDSHEIGAIRKIREAVSCLEGSTVEWEEAGLLARELKRKGHPIALIDCYLATLAQAHDCAILSLDRHFRFIARHRPLSLVSCVE